MSYNILLLLSNRVIIYGIMIIVIVNMATIINEKFEYFMRWMKVGGIEYIPLSHEAGLEW